MLDTLGRRSGRGEEVKGICGFNPGKAMAVRSPKRIVAELC